ncbi:MAG: trigger factor [bacterium]
MQNILDSVKYTLERLPKSQVKITYEVQKEVYEDFKKKAFTKLSGSVKISGFRPGMAPANVTEAYLGANLIEETMSQMFPAVAIAVLEKENVNPIDQVKYDVTEADPIKGIKFVTTFTVYPEVKLPDLTTIKVTKDIPAVTDEDVKKVTDKMIEDAKNAEKDEVKKATIALTDEYVKGLGSKAQTVEEFNKEIKEEIVNQRNMMAEDKYRMDIIKSIVDKTIYDIPDMFVELDTNAREKEYVSKIENLGIKLEDFLKSQKTDIENLRKAWREEAIERIKTEVMLLQVSKNYDIKVTDEDINAELDKIDNKELRAQYDTEDGRRYVFSVLIQQKALAKLVELVGAN